MRQVTAAVIIEHDMLLLARRAAGDPLAGLWELPGGKVEPGETPKQCLERELFEELGMVSDAGQELTRTVYHYDHGSFEMIALETTRMSDFRPVVHDATRWVGTSDLIGISLAPADVELVAVIVEMGLLRD